MPCMLPFVMAGLSAASVAHSQSGGAPGVPSVALPHTTAMLVMQTAKQGVAPQQIIHLENRS